MQGRGSGGLKERVGRPRELVPKPPPAPGPKAVLAPDAAEGATHAQGFCLLFWWAKMFFQFSTF